MRHAVIQSRYQKRGEHRSAVDDDGRQPRRVLLPPGSRDEINQAYATCHCAAALDRGARNLFPQWSYPRRRTHRPLGRLCDCSADLHVLPRLLGSRQVHVTRLQAGASHESAT
jgi:hypothetical protein